MSPGLAGPSTAAHQSTMVGTMAARRGAPLKRPLIRGD
jgi:hypothetical protein